MTQLSFNYRAMIYFAHSTMVIYDKTIKSQPNMSVEMFRIENKDVIQRVFDEGLSIFNVLCMSSGTCTHFQISTKLSVPLLIHGVMCRFYSLI